MPSTAFGPLVEPGWPDLKGPDLAGRFLAGAQLGASINARSRALENQLASYALRAQQEAGDREMDQKKFELSQQVAGWRHEKDLSQIDNASNRIVEMAQYHQTREERLNNALSIKTDQAKANEEGAATAQELLSQNPYDPGTMAAQDYVNKTRLNIPYSPAASSIFTAESKAQENAARTLRKANTDFFKQTEQLTKLIDVPRQWFQQPDSVWGHGKGDMRYILREKSATAPAWQWPILDPGKEQELIEAAKKGDKEAQTRVSNFDYKSIPSANYELIRKGWDHMRDTMHDPAKTPAVIDSPPAAPIPANKADLRLDQPYQSNKGVMRWTGDKFIPW